MRVELISKYYYNITPSEQKYLFVPAAADKSTSFAAKSLSGPISATCFANSNCDSSFGCNRCSVCITLSSLTSENVSRKLLKEQ